MLDIIVAVVLDFLIGDPYSFPHPVKLMGNIISFEDKTIRKVFKSKNEIKIGGFLIALFNIFIAFFIPFMLLKGIKKYSVLYHIINIYLIYTCIAARCLHKEAMKVYNAFNNGIEDARKKISYIVGRDTKNLSEEEIIKADIETVAENTSDGVIAPLFYIFILGAPGGLMYKMINTMDSMLGYTNEKYIDLGYFPAKIDDLFNYIPARLSGVLMCISSIFRYDVKNGFKIMIRDRKNHKSPNSAYPEGAVAGLLNIQLGGSNYYFGKLIEKPTIGDENKVIEKEDIKNTVEIMYRGELLLLVIYTIINLI
ncbi:adenosylcobinamide-phosphate synthase CbiB [Anaerosalibacter massiliensis]|uniref:Cobalamin biosynthesis protein CobD n=1 Tax=Anaerosalibacter massiliensis TaxID=1347392 RepID=A0A9X2MH06_9FIRM|nr:adenosylcobinamide-phosphate synthase CbiB [Anaerosalibacter massiliensis]MCR2043850.1 adenosylcobinamide-phosphate synthase CbiB [Anaerosalibacter massiliensis]